ncbi:MAG: glycosyltransferase [Chloroflexota bacterium]|nr:glycosyltransferase [Chloroflexota bacterium]
MTLSVSVIIPVHNGAVFLPDAIQSVRAQNYSPIEIIVVDDGSTDATADVASSLGDDVHLIRQPKRGVSAARNVGFAAASGDLIAFLDADDLLTPGTIAAEVGCFESNPDIDMVGGYMQLIPLLGADGAAVHAPTMIRNIPQLTVQMGCALFRSALVERVGGFDETLSYAEDVDWHLRAEESGIRRAILHRVTLLYRRHPANATQRTSYAVMQEHYKAVLRRASARRGETVEQVQDWYGDLVPRAFAPLTVSVVITLDDDQSAALAALVSLARQDCLPDEVIVITSRLTDAASAALAPLHGRVRVIAPRADTAPYNQGAAAASSTIIAFLKQSDRWHPSVICTQINILGQHPEIDYLLCKAEIFVEPGDDMPDTSPQPLLSGLAVRRHLFETIGAFDARFTCAFDHEWITRAQDAAVPYFRVEQALVMARPYPGSILPVYFQELIRIRHASLRRRTHERKYQLT